MAGARQPSAHLTQILKKILRCAAHRDFESNVSKSAYWPKGGVPVGRHWIEWRVSVAPSVRVPLGPRVAGPRGDLRAPKASLRPPAALQAPLIFY